MKKLIASVALSIFSALAAYGTGLDLVEVPGPATLNLTAITQGPGITRNRTNTTATSTNILTIERVSFLRSRFDGSNLLAVIENSFNTNFPIGSQIGIGTSNFLTVLDKTGTNIIFPLNSVITSATIYNTNSETIPNWGGNPSGFLYWRGTLETMDNTNGNTGSDIQTAGGSYFGFTFTYDDTKLSPKDGNHSVFQFNGLEETLSGNGKDHSYITSWDVQGTGGGEVDGVETLFTGTISGKTSLF